MSYSNNDEDEDIRRAIALSLGCEDSKATETQDSRDNRQRLTLNQMDRGAMERDRLARAAKRKQMDQTSPPLEKRLKVGVSTGKIPRSTNSSGPSISTSLEYPDGIVKRTWCFGCERQGDIKIEEVLKKEDLNIAVLSAFQWDLEWLFRKLDVRSTKLVLVMQAKGEDVKAQYLQEAEAWGIPHLRLCFPNMSGQVNCMHSKLYDWGENGVLENTVFIIDLPRLGGQPGSLEDLPMFGQKLLRFLMAMGIQQMVIDGLLKFDFTHTAHLGFVHTIGGSHLGSSARDTGFPGLEATVKDLNLSCEFAELDYAASSIGSLNDKFLTNLCGAAEGAPKNVAKISPRDLRSKIKIYFPLDKTVVSSRGGKAAAGTLCLQKRFFYSAKFPRECMRDHEARRKGILSHSKLLFVRGQQKQRNIGWIYVGSANLSESAWGQLVTDRSTKSDKLNCRNWECGVLIPVSTEAMEKLPFEPGKVPPLDEVFQSLGGVPFEFPGQSYGDGKPWFFEDDA